MAYSSNEPKRFPNRRKYWEQRQKLSQSSSTDDSMRRKSASDTKLDDPISMEDIQRALLGIKVCPECKNDDENKFRPVEVDKDNLRFTECMACLTLHGADDTVSPEAAKKWIQSLPVRLCPCGNMDKEKYVFQERDGNLFFRCECCMKEFPLASGAHASNSGASGNKNKTLPTQDSNELECQCGNKHSEHFHLHTINDKLKSIQCLKCNVYVSTQNENEYMDLKSSVRDDYMGPTQSLSKSDESSQKSTEDLLNSDSSTKTNVSVHKFDQDAPKSDKPKKKKVPTATLR